MEDWEGLLEKVKGHLSKWKWLLPHLSNRGCVLICNNLAASLLWHKLMCLDSPPRLLSDIQAALVDSFGTNSTGSLRVLFLPKEEGGQDLVLPPPVPP